MSDKDRFSAADTIIKLDRQQGRPTARRCLKDPIHGRLQATNNGLLLACGICGYAEAATIEEELDESTHSWASDNDSLGG